MISLCMIVRNEAGRLGSCLERARPHIGQMVVVDTGSEDGTPEVAAGLGAEVVHVPFVDFAQTRNAALARARGDWVLVLDADEEIDEDAWPRLVRLAEHGGAPGYCFPRYDYVGNGWGLSRPCRLFRRSAEVVYRQLVFEEPAFPPRLGVQIETCWEIAIHHDGFRRPERLLMERRTLYIQLLERCRRNGDGWVDGAMAYLAADAGDFNRALLLMEAFARQPSERFGVMAALGEARLLLAVGETRRAVEAAERGLLLPFASPYQRSRLDNVRGLALARAGRTDEAADAFRRALSHGLPVAACSYNLGRALLRLDRPAEAGAALAEARRLNPRLAPDLPGPEAPWSYQDRWLHRLDTDNGRPSPALPGTPSRGPHRRQTAASG